MKMKPTEEIINSFRVEERSQISEDDIQSNKNLEIQKENERIDSVISEKYLNDKPNILDYFSDNIFYITNESKLQSLREKDKELINKLKKNFPNINKAFQFYNSFEGNKEIIKKLYGNEIESFNSPSDNINIYNYHNPDMNVLTGHIINIENEENSAIKYIKYITMTIHCCPVRNNIEVHKYSDMNIMLPLLNELYKPKNNNFKSYNDLEDSQKKEFENKLKLSQLNKKQIQIPGFLTVKISKCKNSEIRNKKIHFIISTNKMARGLYLNNINESIDKNDMIFQRGQKLEIIQSNEENIQNEKIFEIRTRLINITPKEVLGLNIFNDK